MAITLISVLAFAIAGTDGVFAFFYPGTFGTLLLLCMYIATEMGAINHLFIKRRVHVPQAEVIIPVLGIAILGYVLYRNVWPVPAVPFNYIAYLTGAWLVLGFAIIMLAPGLAKTIGHNLLHDEVGEETTMRPGDQQLGVELPDTQAATTKSD
jgi:hypothetical protein